MSSLDGDYFVCANLLPKQGRKEFSSAKISPGEACRYKHLEMRIGLRKVELHPNTHVRFFFSAKGKLMLELELHNGWYCPY